jgi:hypothetical protein
MTMGRGKVAARMLTQPSSKKTKFFFLQNQDSDEKSYFYSLEGELGK